MNEDLLLLNPGPVPLSQAVRDVMREPMVSHRSSTFEETYERAQDGLAYVFEHAALDGTRTATDGTPLLVMGTATLGMEAAVANLVESDDEIVTLANGKFGRRFTRIAERYANVTPVTGPWGESLDLETVGDAITDSTDLVTMVHNETSTGLLNPVAEVGALAAEHDARFVVDGVTSIGGDEFFFDEWGVDIAITDAQKALAAPPGISAIYVTDGLETQLDGSTAPFYADLEWYLRKATDHQTPFTSAVPLVRAMATSLEEIEREGMAARIHRHRDQSRAFREAFQAMGLTHFPTIEEPTTVSNTVTAIELPTFPEGSPDEFFDAVATQHVSISGGQGHLGGEIFRVSNMGNLTTADIRRGVRAIGHGLSAVGVDTDVDAGVDALESVLSG